MGNKKTWLGLHYTALAESHGLGLSIVEGAAACAGGRLVVERMRKMISVTIWVSWSRSGTPAASDMACSSVMLA